jgi:15-cis-phytoene synthase
VPDTLETSCDFCRRLSRRAGSTFHAGFVLLPNEQRRAMEAIYAFMRHTDDLADSPAAGGAEERRKKLTAWRAAVREALEEDSGFRVQDPGMSGQRPVDSGPCETTNGKSPKPQSLDILPALADAVRKFRIPPEHLLAVLDGVEMDLDGRRYETFEELETYCQCVASAVGLACIHIWGFRGPEAFEPARRAGIALQLTNILRDLHEDAAAGRVYLPLADLRACGFQPDEFLALANDKSQIIDLKSSDFRRLMSMEIDRAERFYAGAAELMPWLAPPGRRIFGLMTTTYGALLHEIARRPEAVLHGRVRVGRLKRTLLFARWAILPPRKVFLS